MRGGLQLLLPLPKPHSPRGESSAGLAFWLHEYFICWGLELASHQCACFPCLAGAAPFAWLNSPRQNRESADQGLGEGPSLTEEPWLGAWRGRAGGQGRCRDGILSE